MCSVVTNLVTSLEIQPIRCATTLFHFGRTLNGYIATRFVLLSRTAENSATSGYVVAPERSSQNDAWAAWNVERTRKNLDLFPTVNLTEAVCNYMWTWIFLAFIRILFFVFYSLFRCIFLISSYGKFLSSFVYVFIYCVGAWTTNLMSIPDELDAYFFLSKDGTDAVHEGRNGRKGSYFPPESAFFTIKIIWLKYFSLFVPWFGV